MKFRYLLFFAIAAICLAKDKPYTLDACVQYALEHSPELAKQDLKLQNQKLNTMIEQAAFDFKLNASNDHAGHEHRDNTNITLSKEFQSGFKLSGWMDLDHTKEDGFTDTSYAIRLSKTILGGGSRLETEYDLKTSLVDELKVANVYREQRRKIARDVRIAYYDVIVAQQSLRVKERALENAQRTLQMAIEREDPTDIVTAKLKIPDNEQAVNKQKRIIQNGLEALKELMGMPISQNLEITGEFQYKEHKTDLTKDLSFARDNLETFLNNRLERKKMQWLLEIRDWKKWPVVTVSATHYQNSNGDGFNFNGKQEQVYSANLSWTIGSRAELARVSQAKNDLASNQHDYFILDQALATNLTSYYRQLLESAEAVKLQEQICELNRRKEELYRDKWENGETDILELVRTQTALEDSNVELISKKISYLQLVSRYEFTVGR